MDIEFVGDFAASVTKSAAGHFILISRTAGERIDLLEAAVIEIKGRPQTYLRQKLSAAKGMAPLNAIAIRRNLATNWGAILTQHLLLMHEHSDRDTSDVVADTAWRYSTLIAWGEASAAREIALVLNIPVRTIQNRIRIARDRGLIPSPGSGSRIAR